MIKGAIFDLDGTLYDYAANDAIAMKHLCACAKERLGVEEEDFLDAYREAKKLVKTRLTEGPSQHSRLLFCQTALELLEVNPFDHVPELYEAYWGSFLAHIAPFDGVIGMLQHLKASGIHTAVCTDMTAHIQYRKIRHLGLSDYIDALVTSEETGLEKPAPVMFQRTLKKLGLKPGDAVYVGDSLEKDVMGAAACGLRAVWFVAERTVPEDPPYPKLRSYRDDAWKELLL